jgi:hypothetical protein
LPRLFVDWIKVGMSLHWFTGRVSDGQAHRTPSASRIISVCISLTQQLESGEVNFLPKQSAIITAGGVLDIHGDHNFSKTCYMRINYTIEIMRFEA